MFVLVIIREEAGHSVGPPLQHSGGSVLQRGLVRVSLEFWCIGADHVSHLVHWNAHSATNINSDNDKQYQHIILLVCFLHIFQSMYNFPLYDEVYPNPEFDSLLQDEFLVFNGCEVLSEIYGVVIPALDNK